MNREELNILIDKVSEGTASEEELHHYTTYLNHITSGEEGWDLKNLGPEEQVKAELFEHIEQQIVPIKKIKLWPRIAAAAAILLVAGAGLFFYTNTFRHLDDRRDLLNYTNDIAPGKNTATITLANGKTIQLSDAKTGIIIDAASLKYNDGSAVEPSSRGIEGSLGHAVEMTSVATPRGGTYQITLPDGTKVWLNAASSLSFPSTFQGLGNRKVELSGEAYFEVTKDKAHPFIVQTDKQEVEVLGTHFNINSYADEPSTKTTLLEGSVRVVSASRHLDPSPSSRQSAATRDLLNVTLKPNQQAILTGPTQLNVASVDGNDIIAWKEGKFKCKSETLESLMRKVARWYNVDVVYEDLEVKSETFSGTLSRFDNVSKLLKRIELTGEASFKIEGKKIIVR